MISENVPKKKKYKVGNFFSQFFNVIFNKQEFIKIIRKYEP